jgi:DDE superfamily endonuclease
LSNRTDQRNRPANREELYNLRHSSARNAVERIFGILKRRFTILDRPPEYSMAIQARIPPALAAVHNFIRIHDKNEIHEFNIVLEDQEPGDRDYGKLAQGPAGRAEKTRAEIKRDGIAQAMWISYQELVRARGHMTSQQLQYYI